MTRKTTLRSSFVLAALGGLVALGAVAYAALRGPLGWLNASLASAESEGKMVSAVGVPAKFVTIPVEGMSCGACAARIKKTLKPLDGVASVEVSLEHREVRVGYLDGKMTPERLAAEVNSLGYKATLPKTSREAEGATSVAAPAAGVRPSSGEKTVIIPVEGMACESCAETVTNLLKGLDGVKEASVNLKAKEARVRYLEGKVKPEGLAEEVTAQGFPAGPPRAEMEK